MQCRKKYDAVLDFFLCGVYFFHCVCWQDQLLAAEEEQRNKIEMLHTQLEMTQTENARLHREVGNLQRALLSKENTAIEERQSPQGFYPVMSTPEGERQEGEVSGFFLFSFCFKAFCEFACLWMHCMTDPVIDGTPKPPFHTPHHQAVCAMACNLMKQTFM